MHVFVNGVLKIVTQRTLPDGGKYFEYVIQSDSGDVATCIAGKDFSNYELENCTFDLSLEAYKDTRSVNVYKLKLRNISPWSGDSEKTVE